MDNNSDFEYLIRVNYDSGISEEFWVEKFEFKETPYGAEYNWKPANADGPKPIQLGQVESVWQLKTRRAIKT